MNLFKLNVDYSKRTFGLDIVRAYAIIYVVIVHGRTVLKGIDTGFPWIKLVSGIYLFFVLSGLLIGTILIELFENNKITPKLIFGFLKRRWFRTFPNYYLVLLINVFLVSFGIIKGDFSQFSFLYLVFCQNLFLPMSGFFLESWTLTIEEWFYFTFPFALLILSRFFSSKNFKNILLIAIISYIIVPLIIRIIALDIDQFWNGNSLKGTVVFYIDAVAYGILGAYIKKYHTSFWTNHTVKFFICGMLILYFLLYADKQSWGDFDRIFTHMFNSLGLLMILPFFDSIKKGNKTATKIITHISVISYSMYLINLAVVGEVIRDNFPPEGFTQTIVMYLFGYWGGIIVLSTLMYKYFEKPITDLREK